MLIGTRLRSQSPDHSLLIVLGVAVAGCVFAIGLLAPAAIAQARHVPAKTDTRILANGEEVDSGSGWIGVMDAAYGQTALGPVAALRLRGSAALVADQSDPMRNY